MENYKWRQLVPLSDEDRSIDLGDMRPLYDTWHASRERLQNSSKNNLDQFTQGLIRRLSIETGILERLYDLDRGTTEALVTKGFAEELITRSSTDIEPSRLIDILRDQEAAIQLVMDCVAGNRTLSTAVIHELHVILTRHQDTTSAVDQFGNSLEIPLLKGRYKQQENNPKRPDGSLHEYCPPVHIQSEMDRLLELVSGYRHEDPVIVSAWFHHRFTQIHPYQDGNGRVVRAVTTLLLLQAGLLPLVIDRDLRIDYIESLEQADRGDLKPLASLFARLERHAILQALSVDADAEIEQQRRLTSAVIHSLAAKFSRRRKEKDAALKKVNDVAVALRLRTRDIIQAAFDALGKSLSEIGRPDIYLLEGGPDHNNAHWYRFDVIESGKESGKYINFDEAHYFNKCTLRFGRERLVLVVSFHHVGRELSGVMEATAFAKLESFENSEDREVVSQDFFPCSLEPFVFAHQSDAEAIADSFDQWLDAATAVAFTEFGDRL